MALVKGFNRLWLEEARALRRSGASFADIGRAVGLSRQVIGNVFNQLAAVGQVDIVILSSNSMGKEAFTPIWWKENNDRAVRAMKKAGIQYPSLQMKSSLTLSSAAQTKSTVSPAPSTPAA